MMEKIIMKDVVTGILKISPTFARITTFNYEFVIEHKGYLDLRLDDRIKITLEKED
jgi:hypothetical protein